MIKVRYVIGLTLSLSIAAHPAFSNDEYDDGGFDGNYEQEQSYQDESYQDETYADDSIPQETLQDSNALEAEPEPDAYSQELMQDARSTCQQWAQDSGLTGDEKTYYLEDCINSQSGF